MIQLIFFMCILSAAIGVPTVIGTGLKEYYFRKRPGVDYEFKYETNDGTYRYEFKSLGIVYGNYGYTGPDGVKYSVNYVDYGRGFTASGDHLPDSADLNLAHVTCTANGKSVGCVSPPKPLDPKCIASLCNG